MYLLCQTILLHLILGLRSINAKLTLVVKLSEDDVTLNYRNSRWTFHIAVQSICTFFVVGIPYYRFLCRGLYWVILVASLAAAVAAELTKVNDLQFFVIESFMVSARS